MNFNVHSGLAGSHAIFSGSSWRWINYDSDKMVQRYVNRSLPVIGTLLHEFACKYIQHKVKLLTYDKKNALLHLLDNNVNKFVLDQIDFDAIFQNVMIYVNDSIAFRMKPEVVLYYSDRFFGTADAIAFDDKKHILRISDLKTGATPAHMEQLVIYTALFCLEYDIDPQYLQVELRLYQLGECVLYNPNLEDILRVINTIKNFDQMILDFEEVYK